MREFFDDNKALVILICAILLIFGFIAVWRAIDPRYDVWSEGLAGKAELARASYNRQVLVQTAEAQEEAAKYTAQADIVRAQGVAQANQIIGKSLENNKDYLTWKFIDELPSNKNQIIYLPANGQIPFTEASRLQH